MVSVRQSIPRTRALVVARRDNAFTRETTLQPIQRVTTPMKLATCEFK